MNIDMIALYATHFIFIILVAVIGLWTGVSIIHLLAVGIPCMGAGYARAVIDYNK